MSRIPRLAPLVLILTACGGSHGSPNRPSIALPFDPLTPILSVRVDSREGADAIVGVSAVAFDAHQTAGGDKGHYEIQFGDGHSASAPLATHVYESEGTFTATLTLTDASGRSASASQPVVVKSLRGTWFHGGFNEGTRRAQVHRLTITAQDGPEVKGVYSSLGEPDRTLAGAILEARELHVSVDNGIRFDGAVPNQIREDGQPLMLSISGGSAGGLTLPFQPAIAEPGGPPPRAQLLIKYDPVFPGEAMMGMTPISFDASGSQGEQLSVVTEFGDGGYDTAPLAVHAIDRKGSFIARLTVTDRFGRFATDQQTVKVGSFADYPSTSYYGWYNYLPVGEERVLFFSTHEGRHVTGWYSHPDSHLSPFHGTVDGTNGIEFVLDNGTIAFKGKAVRHNPCPLMQISIKGGSADGLTLDFNYFFYY